MTNNNESKTTFSITRHGPILVFGTLVLIAIGELVLLATPDSAGSTPEEVPSSRRPSWLNVDSRGMPSGFRVRNRPQLGTLRKGRAWSPEPVYLDPPEPGRAAPVRAIRLHAWDPSHPGPPPDPSLSPKQRLTEEDLRAGLD